MKILPITIKGFFQFLSIICLILVSLFFSGKYYFWTGTLIPSTTDRPDGITQWENRLKKIKKDLPSSGVVGYIADWDLSNAQMNTDHETEYRLTQYALTPLIVSRCHHSAYIVGNITSAPFDETLADYFDVILLEDYGFGIYLLQAK